MLPVHGAIDQTETLLRSLNSKLLSRIRDENLAKRGIDPTDTASQIKAIEERGKTLMANYKTEMKKKLETWNEGCKEDGELMTVYKSGMHSRYRHIISKYC